MRCVSLPSCTAPSPMVALAVPRLRLLFGYEYVLSWITCPELFRDGLGGLHECTGHVKVALRLA